MVLLAVAHPFSFMTGMDLFGVDPFMLIVLGALALLLEPLLFGIATLRREVLPRYWIVLPLLTGLMGFAWLVFGTDDTGQLTFSFMFRTLFALGWMLLGDLLWSESRKIAEKPSTLDSREAEA